MMNTKVKQIDEIEKGFQVMEQNLKEYLEGDRKHFPSDGGLIEKIDEIHYKEAYEETYYYYLKKYQREAKKILKPAIDQYLAENKMKQQQVAECIDIDQYLNMTKQDLYDAGVDFFVPITNYFTHNGETYIAETEKTISVLGCRLNYPLAKIVPEFDNPNGYYLNCPYPPFPVEYLFSLHKFFVERYLELGMLKSKFSEEQCKKITALKINDLDIKNAWDVFRYL